MTCILVVDDRPDVRLSLLYMLQASGFDVAEAADGAQALEQVTHKRVDVILTDLYMPGFDGLALIRAMRNRKGPQPRIIAMSGADHLGKEAALEAAKVLGAEAILQKPFTREQLVQAIRGEQQKASPPGWKGL